MDYEARKNGSSMTIEFVKGDIFESNCEAFVNPVNCVGVMGAGLALKFKMRFPDYYKAYCEICDSGDIEPGIIWKYNTDLETNPKCIISFPTKIHWKNPSKMRWVIDGLVDLSHYLHLGHIKSIAIPALGCGYGGLAWNKISHAIKYYLSTVDENIKILVYKPL